MLRLTTRLLVAVFLMTLLFYPLQRSWGALQSNRALVVLNQLPSLLSSEIDAAILVRTERQLLTSLRFRPTHASTWRMLALVQRAQGVETPTGFNARDLLIWGQQKQRGGDLEAALYLYHWATDVEPTLADAWYHLGTAYQAQAAWAAVHQAYQQASLATTWHEVGRSDLYAAQGDLFLVMQPPDPVRAGEQYQRALALDQFNDADGRAAAHYQFGELLLWQAGDPATAVPHYRAALAIRPGDHWARLRLGYALYWSNAGVEAAETEILAAIAQWPDEKYLKWPYFYLGEIYENAGLPDKAMAAYEHVVMLDPADERVQTRLALLRSR
jgi:tetratricopeptide (TPR) repeat protein